MPKLRFTWLGLIVGAFYWLLESVLHTLVFTPGLSLSQTLAGEHDPNEIFMRLVIIAILILFGGFADYVAGRKARQTAHIAQLNRLLRFLSEINQRVQRNVEQQKLFEAACRTAVETCGFRIAWIGMQQDGELKLAAWAVDDPRLEDTIRQMEAPLEPGSCLASQSVMRTGEPVLCRLCDKADCEAPWKASAIEQGCEYAAAMPLKINGRTAGVFEVYAEDDQTDEDELTILNEAADDISVALANIEHEAQRKADEAKLKARLDELERFQKATVQREFRIKELRDEIDSLKAELGAKNTEPEA